MEEWKDIKGYEGLYQVSNYGRVKSLKFWSNIHKKFYDREKILKQCLDKKGYCIVGLHKDQKNTLKKVHRLVAEAFIPNPENKSEVNHKWGIKTDNRVSELEWSTTSENSLHAYETGLKNNNRKIEQYDLKGKFMREWNSSREIERKLKISHSNILKCCKGVYSQCNGFIWKYKDTQ